jgi:SAM-dependent methyltransferase
VLHSGDPVTHETRGLPVLEFLKQRGLSQHSRVLELGCGALSLGRPLITFLAPGHYVGVDPAGWAVEAAFQQFPVLESQAPQFLWRDDFSAAELGVSFDVVVACDLASHFAHAQLSQMLAAVRPLVPEGGQFLLSYQRDQMNTWSEVYRPDVRTTFRIETLTATAFQNAWRTEPLYELREQIARAEPRESLDWALLTAIRPFDEVERELSAMTQAHVAVTGEANRLRLEEEEAQNAERQARHERELERVAQLAAGDAQ